MATATQARPVPAIKNGPMARRQTGGLDGTEAMDCSQQARRLINELIGLRTKLIGLNVNVGAECPSGAEEDVGSPSLRAMLWRALHVTEDCHHALDTLSGAIGNFTGKDNVG